MAEEDKKRIELITRPPIQYKYFRLKSGAGRVPEMNILSPFTSDEIEIAKTCIVNKVLLTNDHAHSFFVLTITLFEIIKAEQTSQLLRRSRDPR